MTEPSTNPFPGLRPFLFHEHELFFGREEQYEQMIGKLSGTRFLAVVGTSGSGKSSLVRAGLLPALYGGLMMSAGSRWRSAIFRPKDDPIRELAQALNHRRVFGGDFRKNGSVLLRAGDNIDWPALCARLTNDAMKAVPGPSRRILEFLPREMHQVVLDTAQKKSLEKLPESRFVDAFNSILTRREFYQSQGYEKVTVPGEAQRLLTRGKENLSEEEIQKLNRLLLEATYPQELTKKREIQTRITEATLRRGDLGLIEAVRQARMPDGENLLVVVDQFEELFRYARISENGPHGNQAAAFVKLLLQAKSQQEIPIYVVLTMRSDYLGDCAKFWDLPEAINEGQYLTPRLTRDQRREAIRGPIKERGADITPQLVNQLLNDMGDSPDQLPILQHALMRTWDQWKTDHKDNESIDIRHYDAIGRMAEALSRHADEAYNQLPDESSKEIAKKIFKCLTERGSRNRETRRPTAFKEIRSITEAEDEEIIKAVNVFRQEGRSFLMPSPKKLLTENTLIDISHESLITNWTRLKGWVQEEARAAGAYRRLVESSKLYAKGKSSLLPELEVQYGLQWREENHPNQAWASRYHPFLNENKSSAGTMSEDEKNLRDEKIFKNSMAFLEVSRKTRKQQKEDREKQRRDKLRRARIVAAVLLAAAIGCLYFWRNAVASEELTDFVTYTVNIHNAQRAFAEKNFATAYGYLDTLRDDKKYEDMRGIEWDLLTETCPQDLNIKLEHKDAVLASTFLRDRNLFVTASADGWVKFWRRSGNTWSEDEASRSFVNPVSLINFSANGHLLATVNSARNQVQVWDLNTIAPKQAIWGMPLQRQDSSVALIAFSPDETILAGVVVTKKQDSSTGIENIVYWDSRTGKELMRAESSTGTPLTAIAFLGDSDLVLGTGDGSVKLFNSDLVRGTGDGSVKLFKKATPEIEPFEAGEGIPKPKNSVHALAFFKDQKILVSGRNDGTISLWYVATKKLLPNTSLRNSGSILSVAFSPDGSELAASSQNGSVRLWNTSTLSTEPSTEGDPLKELALLKGHAGAVSSIAFSPDNVLVSTSDDKTGRLWDINKKKAPPITPTGGFDTFSLDPSGKVLAIQRVQDKISVLALADLNGAGLFLRKEPSTDGSKPIPKELVNVSSVAVSSKGILSVYRNEGGKGFINLWEIDKQEPNLTLLGNGWTVPSSDLSLATNEQQRPISASRFSRDGKTLATWSPEAGIRLYDVASGRETKSPFKLPVPREHFRAAAFSPDLTSFVTVLVENVGERLRVFDIFSGEVFPSPNELSQRALSPALSIVFSPDGKNLAIGRADSTVEVWNTRTWKRSTLKGHSSSVQALAFSHDGKRLATGSQDGEIKLWDISIEHWAMSERLATQLKRRELLTLPSEGDSTGIKMLIFSPDGKTLISGDVNGTIRIVGTS